MTKIETPIGTIEAKISPDKTYPGIWIEINGEGMVLVEFNPDIQGARVLVWDPKDPENDPIAIHQLT